MTNWKGHRTKRPWSTLRQHLGTCFKKRGKLQKLQSR